MAAPHAAPLPCRAPCRPLLPPWVRGQGHPGGGARPLYGGGAAHRVCGLRARADRGGGGRRVCRPPLLPPCGYAPLPLITVGAAAVGLVPGVIALLTGRHGDTHRAPRFLFILLLDGAAHTVGSVGIKSLALSLFTEVGFFTLLWPRLLMYLLVVGLESYLLYMLMRSAAVRRELERLLK